MIIIDENIDKPIIDAIRKEYPESFVIRDENRGISDREIAKMASQDRGLIITEDKDFGDLVFYFGFTGFSVILLR